MKIYFVRHGESENNKKGGVTGQLDSPLTEEGRIQAQKTILEIPTDISAIYSSDLVRCKQTAEILNTKLNLPIRYDVRLRERHFGSLSGKKFSEIDATGVMRQKDQNQAYDYRPFGGEYVDDVKKRLFACIDDIRHEKKGEKLLVVTHGGIIRLLHNVLNNKVEEKIHNSSVHEFDFSDLPSP